MSEETDENDELLGMFVQEAVEHLETIEPDLLTLEEEGANTDSEIVNRLFRGVHSIKGSAGFFGLTNITKLSHIMENLLGKVRDGTQEATPDVTDSLLSGLDKLKFMIDDVAESESVDASEEISVIDALLQGGGAAKKEEAPAAEEPAAEAPAEESAPAADAPAEAPAAGELRLEDHTDAVAEAIAHGRNFFDLTLPLTGDANDKKAYFIKMKALLESIGNVVATSPALANDAAAGDVTQEIINVMVCSVLEKDLLQTLVQIESEKIREMPIPEGMANALAEQVEAAKERAQASAEAETAPPAEAAPVAAAEAAPAAAPAPAAVDPAAAAAAEMAAIAVPQEPEAPSRRLIKPAAAKKGAGKGKKGGGAKAKGGAKGSHPAVEETLRVSVSLLDELINNAGELVLARNQLARASVEVAVKYPNIGPLVQNLDSITSRIQEKVMQARMQPVSVVFNKFPRIVRDLARKLKKKIDLELRGGDVDLDKSVIEHLSDPLTHMIRNVADHAIELPQERTTIGKPEAGQVELAAYHENGMVNISLSDDGGGIDAERIKMKAMERGIITERQADVMAEEDALGLIFAPGFSMAKQVSDVSGRGVGMDVVRTNIEKLGGTVQIESKVGKGTRIILKLPLTLAIIPAMIVSAGDQRFAIPEIGLVEIVRVTEADRTNQFEMVGNAPVLRLRNMLLPLVDLTKVLDIQRVWPPESDDSDRRERLTDRRDARKKAQEVSKTSSSLSLMTRPSPEDDEEANRREDLDRRDPTGLVAYVMVLNVAGNEFGMVVDEVLDSEEIVVKPLPSFFKDNTCFSATTILGDGTVSLIIDYAGVMEQANINFSNTEKAARMDLDEERRAALRERQNIILLETSSGLLMGIVHSMVRRVEKITNDLLENIGGLPYVRYDHKTFRAVYPDQVLGLEGMGFGGGGGGEGEEDDLCMVVPNIPGLQAGLIFTRIIDTRETHIDLDCQAIKANGLFGSAQIDDRVVLFPDVNIVFEMAGISPPQAYPIPDATGLSALVVDDTPFLRELTSSYLVGVGFAVDQAEDGYMALDLLRSGEYDLLVTDLKMPMMDGFEIMSELATTPHADIPVIATTSSISSELEQKCSKAGFANCVPTIDKKRLLEVITSLQPENQ
ncbi:MAG: response regulator [Magnetococcales bacterium]|nr:response regulator [Magnetococcales bacterium]